MKEKTWDNRWTIRGVARVDYYSWVSIFEAFHPTFGRVFGSYNSVVYSETTEGFQDFLSNFPPMIWNHDDI